MVGTASWYADGPVGQAAAGPALRVGHWRNRLVTVIAYGRSVVVRLTDYCGCLGTRLIDLSPWAVWTLGLDPVQGLYLVIVRW